MQRFKPSGLLIFSWDHCNRCYGFLLAIVLSLAGCSGGGDSGGQVASLPVLNSTNPGAQFVAASDSERTQLLDEMWSLLTSATCWDASFVGDPTVGGTPASVDQYQFGGNYQYRHVGFSTTVGSLYLHDVGKYYGYTTVIVEIGGYIDAITAVDGTTIAYFTHSPAGAPFVIYYGASDQGCL